MGEATEKVKAAGNKAMGAVKEGVGKATDDPKMVAKGKMQKAKGAAQDVKGTAMGKAGDKI